MPVPQKKRNTAENALSTSEASSLPLPEQQEFHQHLRVLAQSAVRTVLELVMREELDAFIGAAWGECSPTRKGYRNGTYTRNLATATGRLEVSTYPETAKASSIRRSLTAIVALSRILQRVSPRCLWRVQAPTKWEKWPKPCWEWLPVPVPSVGSTRASPNNMRRGGSVLCKTTGP